MKRLPPLILVPLVLLSGCSGLKDEDTYQYQYGYEKGGEEGYQEGYNDALSEGALDYVRKNYSINDVYDDSQIIEYVLEHYDITDLYDTDYICDYATDILTEEGWTVVE